MPKEFKSLCKWERWLLLQMKDHIVIWQPLLKQELLLQIVANDNKLLQTCIEITKHIVFNWCKPKVHL